MTTTEEIEQHSPDDRSVGIVESQKMTLFEPPNRLRLASGAEIGPIEVTYETYGELSPRKDNAIFVCHALTGDAHAAGWHSTSQKKPGWWDEFIGPGKGLDTDRYFVICANVLGGCQGTTGPGSLNPETGTLYCQDFPFLTVGDIVTVHAELVRKLGIERLLAAVGGSLGGMQVLEWAAREPHAFDAAIVLASAAKLSAQGIAFNAVGRRAISTDPAFADGRYYDTEGPKFGLALARMLAHITYLSDVSIEMKFGRRLQEGGNLAYDMQHEVEFQIESYLHYQGTRFVQRFDANSYLYLTRAMDYFDLHERYGSLTNAFAKSDARFLVASYDTDWLFPTSQSQEIVRALLTLGKHTTSVEFGSPYGHDSFLIEHEQLAAMVAPYLEQAAEHRRLHEQRLARETTRQASASPG